jgi:ABC-2 type transport system permease protein
MSWTTCANARGGGGRGDEMDTIMGALRGAFTIWLRDLLRFSRDRARLVSSLGQPLLFLLLFGGGFSAAISGLGAGELDYTQFLFPGILAMTVLFTAVFSAVSIVWDREFGFLKEVMVAPVSRIAVAAGKVAGGSTVALLQGIVILVLAPFLGIQIQLGTMVPLIGILLLLAVMMTSLGLLLAARQRTMEGFHMMMNFLLLPMFFLSGAFFPLEGVPVWMHVVASIDPVTYGVDPLRQIVLGGQLSNQALDAIALHPIGLNVLLMIGLAALFLIPGVWLFSKQE